MTLNDRTELLAFSNTVTSAASSVSHLFGESWVNAMNNAISVLPATVHLTGSAAQDFFRWKGGYDEFFSVGDTLLSMGSVVVNLLTVNFAGAAASMAKLWHGGHEGKRKYKAFLDSDECLAACSEIMGVYNAEIEGRDIIKLSRATAWTSFSTYSGGDRQHLGGDVTDRR